MGNILPKNNVILAGDFNAPDINWPNLDSSTYLTSPSERLLEMIDEHDLKQLVDSPTRRQGNTQNTLDLVFTNNAGIVSGTEVVPGISDHDMVLFSVKTSCRKKKNVKRKVYIKRKANCSHIKEMLNEFADSFMENLKELSVDEMWDTFECSIRSIMDACIPHKMTSSRYNLPWFNRSLRRQSRAKQRLYNKAKRSQNPQHWSEFRDTRKCLHKNLKSAREKYVSDYLGESIKENPKRFWSFVKHLKKDDPGVADFKVDGQIICDGVMKSDLLNKQFSNVYTKEDLASIPAVGHSPKPTIGSLTVTLPGVIKQLTSLKPNKAIEPDQIPPWFLKEYAHEIGPILTLIYQASINSGIVPSRWKYANVCGVFKGGQKSNPCNYRPISLTCIASKVLEHIVHSHVMKHLDSHRILTDVQHGFRAKRSTVTLLIINIHDLAKTIQDNKSVHAAILDFSKAFDKVPHQRLLRKLEYYGIRENLLKWFESFLIGRTQSVICDGSQSKSIMVTSGVPQGTVLGPLLFLLYVNDLPANLQSSVRLFADDALLYGIISNEVDCNRLQADLFELERWQDRWKMKFNPSKCKIICISTKKSPPLKKYVFCGSELDQIDSVSYLGVTLTNNLKWSQHVSSVLVRRAKSLV